MVKYAQHQASDHNGQHVECVDHLYARQGKFVAKDTDSVEVSQTTTEAPYATRIAVCIHFRAKRSLERWPLQNHSHARTFA